MGKSTWNSSCSGPYRYSYHVFTARKHTTAFKQTPVACDGTGAGTVIAFTTHTRQHLPTVSPNAICLLWYPHRYMVLSPHPLTQVSSDRLPIYCCCVLAPVLTSCPCTQMLSDFTLNPGTSIIIVLSSHPRTQMSSDRLPNFRCCASALVLISCPHAQMLSDYTKPRCCVSKFIFLL